MFGQQKQPDQYAYQQYNSNSTAGCATTYAYNNTQPQNFNAQSYSYQQQSDFSSTAQNTQEPHSYHQNSDYQTTQTPSVVPSARWSWSLYPTNRLDGLRMVVPLGCMYTPLDNPCPELYFKPVICTVCNAVLNPYSGLDLATRTWSCPMCLTKNNLPPMYAHGDEPHNWVELVQRNATVEYVNQEPRRHPPTFAFAVDTCLDTQEEVEGLKEFLRLVLEKIPENANVCLVTYGAAVQLHEITGATQYPRSIVFRGSQEISPAFLEKSLVFTDRYVAPLSTCAAVFTSLIDNLSCDLWPVAKAQRALRCTGAAISAVASLLKLTSSGIGSCILTFMSGVCTVGPGIVVDTSREHTIRGHKDIRDGTNAAKHWTESCAFYDKLMQRIVEQGHALNCFAASLDQLGIAEMKQCIQASGGVVLNSESWRQKPFRVSLNHFFSRKASNDALLMRLNATFDVITSPSWKVLGVIGQCIGTGKKSASVGDHEIGMGGTCQWTTCMLDSHSTFAVYFDTSPSQTNAAQKPFRYVQFITRYEQGNQIRTRVTTLAHKQQQNPPIQDIVAAFDQEAAAVLIARQAIHNTDSMPLFDVLRWLDRTLVRLVSRFGNYTKNQPSTLRLPAEFVYFPAFIYHLRRSGYLQVFNSSPDESSILWLQLLKSSTTDSIVQIQPTLYSYRMDAPPQSVPLDSTAIQRDNILLLDTFFEVLVHHGSTVVDWERAGYANMQEYAYFREFLDIALADAKMLVDSRYPTPRLIVVCQDDPDSRILFNRINPSHSYSSAEKNKYGSQEGELVYTDDASLQIFMEHLKKLAVSS
ncbi:unnamed protein product [Phytomonas sp. Hart1]|nr:unnamed protein product [Phytomonas sp. Hart1]|eukprot:CCW70059.1 unnamed protein product [Phytomonas sp. isolate Hart1]